MMELNIPLVIFIFVLLSHVFCRSQATETPSYESPIFKDWINEDWSFKPVAVALRDAINNNVAIPWSFITYVEEANLTGNLNVEFLADSLMVDQLGLLIPASVGYLLALFMPVILLLVCCCRCCGNCGGASPSVEDIQGQWKVGLMCNGMVVCVAAGIIIAMACGVPISGIRMKGSTGVVVDSLKYGARDLPIFVSTFVNESKVVVADHLNSTIDSIADKIRDLPNVLTSPLTNSTSGFFTHIEDDMDAIQQAIDTFASIEVTMNATVDSVSTHLDDLATALNELNANLTTIKDKCVADGELFCSTLLEGSTDTVDFDTAALTDMAGTISELANEAKAVNLTGYLAMGNQTFQSIPEIIQNASESTVVDILAALEDVPGTILPEVNSMLDTFNNMSDSLDLEEQVTDLTTEVVAIDASVDPIFNLVMQTVGGYLGLIGGTALFGLLVGLFGRCVHSGDTLGRGAFTTCGAGCLCCSAVLAGSVIFIVLLIGSTLLIVGGNLTVLCHTVQEVTLIEQIMEKGLLFDGDSLGSVIFDNENVNISFKDFIYTCRAGGTLFATVNIGEMVNITDMLDASEFVPTLDDSMYDSINSTIGEMNVYDADFLNEVSAQLELPSNGTSTDNIQSIKDEINGLDLLQISQNMTDVADTLPDPWYADSYRSIAATLSATHYQTKVPLLTSIDDLETNINNLNSSGNNIKLAIEDLNTTLSGMQSFIQAEAVNVIFESINNFLDSMLHVPEQFVDNIIHTLTTDIGQCQILGDMYDSITGSVCVYFLDSFNFLWMGLYTSGITFIILMLANCLLCKYFRRPGETKEDKIAMFDSKISLKKVKSLHPGKRSQFSTSSDSPQLLRVNKLKETLKEMKERRQKPSFRASMAFYESIQPKIEHRKHRVSGSTYTLSEADESDGYSVEKVCDLNLDLQRLPDGYQQTSFAFRNKVTKHEGACSGNQIVSHESYTYQDESRTLDDPGNSRSTGVSGGIDKAAMSPTSDETSVQIDMTDNEYDDQDICGSSKEELSSEHSYPEMLDDSVMCNIGSSHGTRERIADSFSDHINDFEVVYHDISGIGKEVESGKKLDSDLKHTKKEYSKRVLNIQVQPYSKRKTEKGTEIVDKTNVPTDNNQSAFSFKLETKQQRNDTEESKEWYSKLNDSTFQELNYQSFAMKQRAARPRDSLARTREQKQSSEFQYCQTDLATDISSFITLAESNDHDSAVAESTDPNLVEYHRPEEGNFFPSSLTDGYSRPKESSLFPVEFQRPKETSLSPKAYRRPKEKSLFPTIPTEGPYRPRESMYQSSRRTPATDASTCIAVADITNCNRVVYLPHSLTVLASRALLGSALSRVVPVKISNDEKTKSLQKRKEPVSNSKGKVVNKQYPFGVQPYPYSFAKEEVEMGNREIGVGPNSNLDSIVKRVAEKGNRKLEAKADSILYNIDNEVADKGKRQLGASAHQPLNYQGLAVDPRSTRTIASSAGYHGQEQSGISRSTESGVLRMPESLAVLASKVLLARALSRGSPIDSVNNQYKSVSTNINNNKLTYM